MAMCKYCDRKGIFLKVSKMGLCPTCEGPVNAALSRHIEVIKQSAKIIDESKKFETRISRVEVVIQNVETIRSEYLARGVSVEINPDTLIANFEKIKSQLIEEEAFIKVNNHLDKAKLAKTLSAKINNANKAIIFLKEWEETYGYINKDLTIELFQFVHQSEYNDLLLKAEKEEFKGNNKKAIDKYQDVLFFLKKDDVDDNLQINEINEVENKIKELST